jgi:hypothetical protein
VLAATGAIVGALAGAAVQASWFLDADPQVNWTLPAPHTFSAPGWYHAGFFVAFSSFAASSLLLMVGRLRSAGPDVDVRTEVTVLVGAVACFLGLVVADSWPSASTSSSAVTILASVAVLVAGLGALVWAARAGTQEIVWWVLSSVVGAAVAWGIAAARS